MLAAHQEVAFVAGHLGMVGSAISRAIRDQGDDELVVRTRGELDLSSEANVNGFFAQHAIEKLYLAAAKVGGIHANNQYPAQFIFENLQIQSNVLHAAYQHGVKRVLFLGSSCVYPRECPQPITESSLLSGPLEPTNEPYAVAKIAGITLCESYNRQYGTDFRCVMPTNLYGPGDNFHPENAHVIAALMRRMHEAKCADLRQVTLWGTGSALREFLHVDDLARACVQVMELPRASFQAVVGSSRPIINVGSGEEISIHELAQVIRNVVGYRGDLIYDQTKPDGTPRKLLDCSRMKALGFRPTVSLEQGLVEMYRSYCQSLA